MNYRQLSLGYPGGKSKCASKIIAKFPEHRVYVEPFAGAAHVFFKKPKAHISVLNDKNAELINFFKRIAGKRVCCRITDSRRNFERVRGKHGKSVCDYIFLNRVSYGSARIFANSATYANRKKKMDGQLCVDGTKLAGVRLLNQDFRKVIQTYDSPSTLFYVDPPYVAANEKSCLYGNGNCQVSPDMVARALKGIKGKAIISYDDHPEVRKAFKGCKVESLKFTYTFARDKQKRIKGKRRELIIDCSRRR